MCVCVLAVGEEQAKSQVSLASTNQLSLTVTETDLSNLTASIRRPSGQEEPCGLRRQPSGQLGKRPLTALQKCVLVIIIIIIIIIIITSSLLGFSG